MPNALIMLDKMASKYELFVYTGNTSMCLRGPWHCQVLIAVMKSQHNLLSFWKGFIVYQEYIAVMYFLPLCCMYLLFAKAMLLWNIVLHSSVVVNWFLLRICCYAIESIRTMNKETLYTKAVLQWNTVFLQCVAVKYCLQGPCHNNINITPYFYAVKYCWTKIWWCYK